MEGCGKLQGTYERMVRELGDDVIIFFMNCGQSEGGTRVSLRENGYFGK